MQNDDKYAWMHDIATDDKELYLHNEASAENNDPRVLTDEHKANDVDPERAKSWADYVAKFNSKPTPFNRRGRREVQHRTARLMARVAKAKIRMAHCERCGLPYWLPVSAQRIMPAELRAVRRCQCKATKGRGSSDVQQ